MLWVLIRYLSEALLMSTTTYVFVEKSEKYQQFSAEEKKRLIWSFGKNILFVYY